jgi:hypothetical protein
MFGGVEAGEITDPDPVRETAAPASPAWASTSDAASGWLDRYSSDWVVPGDGGGRRLAVLEEQGVHAEVTYRAGLGGGRPGQRCTAANKPKVSRPCGRVARTTGGWSTSVRPRRAAAPVAFRSTFTTWIARWMIR